MKTLPVRAVLFHEDGRTDGYTDLTKQIVSFAILSTRLKKRSLQEISAFPIGISKWRWLFILLTL